MFAQGLFSSVRLFAQFALNCLYPPGCAACGIRLLQKGALCSACWCNMRFIERPYCDVLGIPFSYDPGPGMVSAEAIANPPPFAMLRAVATHEGPVRQLVHGLKYADRTDLAPLMAAWMVRAGAEILARADVIMPIPLHRFRLLSRQYNQAAELARAMSRQTGIPFLPNVLNRIKRTRQQVGLSAKKRSDNLRGAFKVAERSRDLVFGKRIVLIDDVYTTGATVRAACRALKAAGAAEIFVLTFAMALVQPI